MKSSYFFITLLLSFLSFSQEKKKEISKEELRKAQKAEMQSQLFAYEGYKAYKEKKIPDAEMDYRKSISKDKKNSIAIYNMGDVVLSQKAYKEAESYYKEVSMNKNATKEEKHKAFHNLGNLAMREKEYSNAVSFYKEALRNDPTDEETRYNLAVAKDLLKKDPKTDRKNDNNNQKYTKGGNKEDKNNKDSKDNQDKKQQENDKNNPKNPDNKDNKDKNKEDNDQNKNPNPKDDDNKNQNNPNNDNKNKENNNSDENNTPNTPQEGEFTPEQIKRILNAIDNEEKKTQEKINAEKIKGKPNNRSNKKDW